MNQVYNLSDANKDELIASLLESMLANTKLIEALTTENKRLKTFAKKYVLCPSVEQEIKDLKEQLQEEKQKYLKLQALVDFENKQERKKTVKKIVITYDSIFKLDNYFREQYMEEDVLPVKTILEIIEGFAK